MAIESRAIGDALNMMCHFYALNVLPLGDVMMIAAVRVTFPRHQKSFSEEGGVIWATPESTHNFLRISFLVRLTHKICSGDHCQLLLLHLLERALWSLRDPQHLH